MNKLVAALLLAGCFSPQITDGKLHCAADHSCPDGYTCADDNTCWRHPPTGMVQPDLANASDLANTSPPPDLGADLGAVHTAHGGLATPAGGIRAQSEHFKAVMSTGAPPGGNSPAASSTFKLHPGIAGATQ